jgi:hypothetical protein
MPLSTSRFGECFESSSSAIQYNLSRTGSEFSCRLSHWEALLAGQRRLGVGSALMVRKRSINPALA